MLRLLLNEYGIYDVDTLADNVGGIQGDTLAAWLRSDDVRARAAAYGGTAAADSTVDAGTLTVDDESVVEVAVAEAMITEAFQIADEHVAREVAARHTAEERALHEAAARQAAEQTAVAVDTADASTCHYLLSALDWRMAARRRSQSQSNHTSQSRQCQSHMDMVYGVSGASPGVRHTSTSPSQTSCRQSQCMRSHLLSSPTARTTMQCR